MPTFINGSLLKELTMQNRFNCFIVAFHIRYRHRQFGGRAVLAFNCECHYKETLNLKQLNGNLSSLISSLALFLPRFVCEKGLCFVLLLSGSEGAEQFGDGVLSARPCEYEHSALCLLAATFTCCGCTSASTCVHSYPCE